MSEFNEHQSLPPHVIEHADVPTTAMCAEVLMLTMGWMFLSFIVFDQVILPPKSIFAIVTFSMILPVFFWLKLHPKFPIKKTVRWNYPGVEHLLLAIPIGLSSAIVVDQVERWWALLVPASGDLEELRKQVAATNLQEWSWVILGAVIIAPLVEEILFRGFLQGVLEVRKSAIAAIIITALVFSLFHLNFSQFLAYWVLSLILSTVAWRVDSIFPSMIVHAINNLLSVYSLNQPGGILFAGYERNGTIALEWSILAVVVLAFSLYRYVRFDQPEPVERNSDEPT